LIGGFRLRLQVTSDFSIANDMTLLWIPAISWVSLKLSISFWKNVFLTQNLHYYISTIFCMECNCLITREQGERLTLLERGEYSF